MTALGLGTAVLLRVFRFKNHINIPASGLQFVVVIFEIGIAWWICDFYDSTGGRQCGSIFGTGSSNNSTSMVHIRMER